MRREPIENRIAALRAARAAGELRLQVAVSAVAGALVPRADADVLRRAAQLLDDDHVLPDRVLVLVAPRQALAGERLADVDAAADERRARALTEESTTVDADRSLLLRSEAARLGRRARQRRDAERGLDIIDAAATALVRELVVDQLCGWLSSAATAPRFAALEAVLPSSSSVLRTAVVLGAARRLVDAVVTRVLAPFDDDAATDDDAVCAALDLCLDVVDAVAAFDACATVAVDDVLWDLIFADQTLRARLGADGDGDFCAEVVAARAAALGAARTAVDVAAPSAPSLGPWASVVQARERGFASPPPTASGQRLGRYELLERLGAGGMAEVWLARQDGPRGFQKEVVLKHILAAHAGDPYFIGLFQKEARLISQLHHPNIVDVFDLGVEGDRWFITMERLRGKSLMELRRRFPPGTFPVDVAARACADAARGLGHAHACPVIHRDVSPDNLFVTDAGLTKVIDFGVAQRHDEVKAEDPLVGKVPYMAPELFRGEAFDGAIDVFALGVSLWSLLIGRLPFQASSPQAIAQLILTTTAPPVSSLRADVPVLVEEVLTAMVAPRAADRPDPATIDALLSSCAASPTAMAALVG